MLERLSVNGKSIGGVRIRRRGDASGSVASADSKRRNSQGHCQNEIEANSDIANFYGYGVPRSSLSAGMF